MSHRRPIVQVVAHLKKHSTPPSVAAEKAIGSILNWLTNKQKIKLPDAAFRGHAFEIDVAEGQPVSVTRLDEYWSLQFDRFDSDVPGRIWRTEASVYYSADTALAGVRLAVIDSGSRLDFNPSVPRVIGDLIRSPGLYDYGVDLSDSPSWIESESELDDFISLLGRPERTRPVLVLSDWSGSNVHEDSLAAAQRLAGLAHVYVLREGLDWKLTDRLGREFSVWNGAVRTYYPGFDPAVDEITQHPPATREWLTARFGNFDRFLSVLVRSFALRSVREAGIESSLPSYREVKQVALQKQLARLSDASKRKSEREQLLEEQVDLLKQQVKEKSDEYNLADGEVKQAEAERDQYRAQLSSLRVKIDSMEERLGTAEQSIEYPNNLERLDEWALQHFPGRLIVLNRAARAARKSPFNEPELLYKCLERLARDYVDARRLGKPVDSLFENLGVHLERTGDPARLSQWKEEYFVPHRTRNEFLEWHLKRGSDKNEANTLRIYFFYDEDDQQVIIGHLPGHLTNEMT
jgi:hypothetical protein